MSQPFSPTVGNSAGAAQRPQLHLSSHYSQGVDERLLAHTKLSKPLVLTLALSRHVSTSPSKGQVDFFLNTHIDYLDCENSDRQKREDERKRKPFDRASTSPCHLSTQSSGPAPAERGTIRAHTILVALGATNSFVRAASSTPAFQTVQYSVFRLGMGAGSRRISLEFVAKRKAHPLANWSGPRLSCGPTLIRAPPPLGISGYRPHIDRKSTRLNSSHI